jgi:hypothetical protein
MKERIEKANRIFDALTVTLNYGLNTRMALTDCALQEKARELVELVANLPGTPEIVREAMLAELP